MNVILELLFQGLIQWLFNLSLEIVEYMSNSLLGVFNMDLGYFESVAPVSVNILNILMAVGWALLLGNLVFQASKSMVSGIGLEGEDPWLLFLRTFVFGFLLLASRQICDIGLGLTSTIIAMLQVPDSVTFHLPEEAAFPIGASWLLVVIVGVVVMWQVFKLFLEIGERYVVMAILTLSAPLAFATGGSKSTADIFKGWVRMFGSMCVIMVFNVIFLKLLLSAMSYMPIGLDTFPWMLVIIGIARVARKIDGIITRIGLNPAITGEGLGRGGPGMLAYAVIKSMGSMVGKTIGAQGGHRPSAGTGPKSGGPRGPRGGFGGTGPSSGSTTNRFADGGGAQSPGSAQTGATTAGASRAGTTAETATPTGAAGKPGASGTAGMAGGVHTASTHQERQDVSSHGTAGTAQTKTAENPSRPQSGGTRRTSVTGAQPAGFGHPSRSSGMAGTAGFVSPAGMGSAAAPGGTAGSTSPTGMGRAPAPSGTAGTTGPTSPTGLGRAAAPGGTAGSAPKGTGPIIHPDRPIPQQPQGSGRPDTPGQATASSGPATTRFTATPASGATGKAPHPGGVRQSSGESATGEERRSRATGVKSPRPGQSPVAAPTDCAASKQSRVSERTSTQSSVIQTGQAAQSSATQAVSPTGHAATAGQERPPSSVTGAGQHTEHSRPARQESVAPSVAQAGQHAQRPLSGTAGTAPGQRPAQSTVQGKPPRPPAEPGGAAPPGKRAAPGGKTATAPKAQSQRPTRGGGKNGG